MNMYKYDTFFPRLWAIWIDGIVCKFAVFVLSESFKLENTILNILVQMVSLNLPYIYSVMMHANYSQTIGKMLLNIKIVTFPDEEKISYSHAFMRDVIPIVLVNLLFVTSTILFWDIDPENFTFSTFGYVIMFFPATMIVIWSLAEIFTMLFDNYNRAIHDKIAGTVVVRV